MRQIQILNLEHDCQFIKNIIILRCKDVGTDIYYTMATVY